MTRQIMTFGKAVLFLCLAASFSFIKPESLLAQENPSSEWYPVGAVWHYQTEPFSPPYHHIGYDKYTVVSSEAENGYLKKKIEHQSVDHLGKVSERDYIYRYVRGAKVYEQKADSMQLLFDFEAKPGDRLDIYIHRFDTNDTNENKPTDVYFKLKEYQTVYDENKKPLRKAILELYERFADGSEKKSDHEYSRATSPIEYVGSDFMFDPKYVYAVNMDYMDVAMYLRCYTDGALLFYNPTWKKDKWYGRNKDCEAVFNYLRDWPDAIRPVDKPVGSHLVLRGANHNELMLDNGADWQVCILYNLEGKVVKIAREGNKMDLSAMPRSVYVAQVRLQSGEVFNQKICL